MCRQHEPADLLYVEIVRCHVSVCLTALQFPLAQAVVEQVARDHALLRTRIQRMGGAAGVARLEAGLAAARAAAAAASGSSSGASSGTSTPGAPFSHLFVYAIIVCLGGFCW